MSSLEDVMNVGVIDAQEPAEYYLQIQQHKAYRINGKITLQYQSRTPPVT